MVTLEGPMLWNRLLWIGISVMTLALVYVRFRFAHRTATDPFDWLRSLRARVFAGKGLTLETPPAPAGVSIPQVRQEPALKSTSSLALLRAGYATKGFALATHLRQMLAITRSSFRMIATSLPGLFLLVAFPMMLSLVLL